MRIQTEIICKNYKHKKIQEDRIITNESSEEYYIIPFTKDYKLESDSEVYKLTFNNQQLWLKYSNYWKQILINNEFNYADCILIKSSDILDIYVKLECNSYMRKNTWQSKNIQFNKKYRNKYLLTIPIIDEMINIKSFGEGIQVNQIELITNEIILKQTSPKTLNCNYPITNNIQECGEALFIPVSDDNLELFQ